MSSNLDCTPKIFSGPSEKFFDLDNPQHFINLISPETKERILKIPEQYFLMPEINLIRQTYGDTPYEMDAMLRMEFWDRYNTSFIKAKKIKMADVYSGICSSQAFTSLILNNPGRLAYIFREPIRLNTQVKYAYEVSVRKLLASLDKADGVNARTGLPDAGLLKLKFEIFKYLDQRLHGSVIQRVAVEQKTLQVNVDGGKSIQSGSNSMEYSNMTADEVHNRIRDLELQISQTGTQLLPPADPTEIIMAEVIKDVGRVTKEFEKSDKRKPPEE